MNKTVKVRILVAVDPAACWSAFGCSIGTDAEVRSEIYVDDLHNPAFHWITAEVPIPETTDIPGVVE